MSLRSSLLLSHDCSRLKHSLLQCRGLEWNVHPVSVSMTVSSFHPTMVSVTLPHSEAQNVKNERNSYLAFISHCVKCSHNPSLEIFFFCTLAPIKRTPHLLAHISNIIVAWKKWSWTAPYNSGVLAASKDYTGVFIWDNYGILVL